MSSRENPAAGLSGAVNPDSVLRGLDPEQREIATTLRGPLCVLAGAGTGKTRAITHRIAYGVLTGMMPADKILALTFTKKAAGELQSRLRALHVSGVSASTFHAAALAQLNYFWGEVVGGKPPQLLSGKAAVLGQIAAEQNLVLSKENLRDVASEIEWRKTTMLSIDSYAKRLGARQIPGKLSAEQLLGLHSRYAEVLEERRMIDFEDVLLVLLGMLTHEPRVAHQVRQRYRYFTVDEYQDVSPLQHELLRAWMGQYQELCVVGDASQTIYSFAGADNRFLLNFGHEFRGASVVRLERNYRSTPEIVRAANFLMRDRPGALVLRAMREQSDNPEPVLELFVSAEAEAQAVASAIHENIAAGVKAQDIAILYRTNAQAAVLEAELQRLQVPYRVHGATRFYERADVKQAIMLLRGEAKIGGERPLFQIVSDVLRAVGWREQTPAGAAARESWEALQAIMRMAEEMPAGTGIREFAAELLARQRAQHEPEIAAVTLSAVHAAKGLEWDTVYLLGVSEGLMPISLAVDAEQIAEERRLFYVALTRAKRVLRLSAAVRESRVSRFIAECGIRIAGAAAQSA